MESTKRKILIIEDDRFVSEMYARTLKKAGFYIVESFAGPDGLEKARAGGWDYILLDIMLPDITGVEILQELRSTSAKRGDTKIIVMTNFEQDDATRQSMEQLADGYLIKAEITPRRLVEIIQEMENQLATPPSNVAATPTEAPPEPSA